MSHAPGTIGSLLALLLLIIAATALSPSVYAFTLAIAIVAAIIVGIPVSTQIEKMDGISDPGYVVIDEAAGQWISFLFIPLPVLFQHPWLFVAGFILFRLFDITKPFPVKTMEKFPGGYGIMMDDIIAGLYTSLSLNLIVLLIA